MAGRKKAAASAGPGAEARAAIDTVRLVEHLQLYALGETDADGNAVELDASRLKVIEMLLKKTLPDLASVSLAGEADKTHEEPIRRIIREIVDPAEPA